MTVLGVLLAATLWASAPAAWSGDPWRDFAPGGAGYAPLRAYTHVATTSDNANDADPGEFNATLTAGDTAVWFWLTEDDAATTDSISPSQAFENDTTVVLVGTYQLHVRAICASTGGSTTLSSDSPVGAQVIFMGVARYTGIAASGCFTEGLTDQTASNVATATVANLTCTGACLRFGVMWSTQNPAATSGTQRHEDTNGSFTFTYNVQDQTGGAGDASVTWSISPDGAYQAIAISLEEAAAGAATPPGIFNNPIRGGGFDLLARLLEMRHSRPFGPRLVSLQVREVRR